MLRWIVLGGGMLMLLGAAVSAVSGPDGTTVWLLVMGLLLTIGTAFERVLYKRLLHDTPGPGWTRTEERFVDPETGQTVDVFFNPASGERRYVTARPKSGGSR